MGGNLVLLILILAPFEVANHAETDWDSQTNEQQLLGRRLIVVTLPLLINKQTGITFRPTCEKIIQNSVYSVVLDYFYSREIGSDFLIQHF